MWDSYIVRMVLIILYCDVSCCEIVLTNLWLKSSLHIHKMEKTLHMLYILRQVNQGQHSWTDQLVEIELSIIARACNDSEFINIHSASGTDLICGRQAASLERTVRPNPSRSLQISPLYPHSSHWSWSCSFDICPMWRINLIQPCCPDNIEAGAELSEAR